MAEGYAVIRIHHSLAPLAFRLSTNRSVATTPSSSSSLLPPFFLPFFLLTKVNNTAKYNKIPYLSIITRKNK